MWRILSVQHYDHKCPLLRKKVTVTLLFGVISIRLSPTLINGMKRHVTLMIKAIVGVAMTL